MIAVILNLLHAVSCWRNFISLWFDIWSTTGSQRNFNNYTWSLIGQMLPRQRHHLFLLSLQWALLPRVLQAAGNIGWFQQIATIQWWTIYFEQSNWSAIRGTLQMWMKQHTGVWSGLMVVLHDYQPGTNMQGMTDNNQRQWDRNEQKYCM